MQTDIPPPPKNLGFAGQNSTFRGGEPTWANACVGENGSPQIFDYATGFASAANVLLDTVIAQTGLELPVDTLVYPVCFNMRHAVELFLKAAAQHLERLAARRGLRVEQFDLVGSHNLAGIWEYVKRESLEADLRYHPLIAKLGPYIDDVAAVDATGQVFRYPFDTDNRKHLTDVALINFRVLKSKFSALEKLLHALNRLNEELGDEYAWGTHTRHLSRAQLWQIAFELPPRQRWSEGVFDEIKAALLAKYKVSSREFSKAIKLIEQRHEMAAHIGICVEITGLSLQALQIFVDQWITLHDLDEVKNPGGGQVLDADDVDFEELQAWHVKRFSACDTLVQAIQVESLAALRALYYFDREARCSEAFDRVLAIYAGEAKAHAAHPDRFYYSALQLLDKPGALISILRSLNFLGQKSLLAAVLERYGLQGSRGPILGGSQAGMPFNAGAGIALLVQPGVDPESG